MNGLELSERFFHDLVYPVIRKDFPKEQDCVSAAMLGDGSEVLGYDDSMSHDHNFSPRVTLFLPDDTFDRIGRTMAEHLKQSLPERYANFMLLWTDNREAVQVRPLRRHFCEQLDAAAIPRTPREWLKCDEQRLLELTAGKVFRDPNDQLAGIRQELVYYPPEVRLYLLYTAFVRMSECAGVERALQRSDWIAIHHYAAYFAYFAIKAVHLLERRFCPYPKWMARNLQGLSEFGREVHDAILTLLSASTPAAVREGFPAILVKLGTRVTSELDAKSLRWSKPDELFLLDFDWSAVTRPLRRQMPEELRNLSLVVSPASYLGMILDYTGFEATYEG